MNQEDIFKKVGQILNELQDQYEFLAQNPKQLNELELELFLANANFLSDHVQIVRKINNNKVLKAIPEHTETPAEINSPVEVVKEEIPAPQVAEIVAEAEEFQVQEHEASLAEEVTEEIETVEEVTEPLKFEFILSDTPETDKFEFEEKPVDAIFDRPLSREEEEIIAQKQKLREAAEPAPLFVPDQVEEKVVLPVTPEPILDKVEEKTTDPNALKPTLNDLLAGKSGQPASFNEGSSKPAIADLKQAINLNEKLLYIKDLFNGYNLAYAEAIELINKMPDFKTADAFLKNNYAEKNNWSAKQNTVDQFYELLNQRFPVK